MTGLCASLTAARIFFAYRVADFLHGVANCATQKRRETEIYGKIFEDIFCSTLMDCGGDTAYVFIAMIVLSDENGVIKHTAESLARMICKDVASVRQAIEHLEAADSKSNLRDHEGSRIVPLSELSDDETRGWLVVNKEHYRDKKDPAEVREQNRIRAQRFRDKHNATSRDVTPSNAKSRHTDTDTDTDTSKNTVGLKADDARRHGLERTRELRKTAFEIIKFLNDKAGKNYQAVKANVDLIVARLKEGGTPDDMRAIIAKKCREWQGRDGMEEYLRPATLFGSKNFWQKYQGELPPQ